MQLAQSYRRASFLARASSRLINEAKQVKFNFPVGESFTQRASMSTRAKKATKDTSAAAQVDAGAQTKFLSAASQGELENVKTFVEKEAAAIDASGYDKRTALHLACAEGQLEVADYLLSKGANPNSVDRWGIVPLEAAITNKHMEIVSLLTKSGASFPEKDLMTKFCDAAGRGDVQVLAIYKQAGANVNAADYDKRTPLHLAAAEGQTGAVQFLLKNGAGVNSVDRFGNTPLDDAERGTGRHYRSCAKILREEGGVNSIHAKLTSGVDFRTAVHDTLPMLTDRWGYAYAETWMPGKIGEEGEEEFHAAESFVVKEKAEALRPFTEAKRAQLGLSAPVLLRVLQDKQPILISDPAAFSDVVGQDRVKAVLASGVKKIALVPTFDLHGEVNAIVKFFFTEESKFEEKDLRDLAKFLPRIVQAGSSPLHVEFDPPSSSDVGQMQGVFKLLVSEGVFSPALIYNELDWFYNMGFPDSYFKRFDNRIIANHIHSFIASKKFATTTGSPEDLWLQIENNEKLLGPGGPQQLLYMIPHEHHKMVAAERKIVQRIGKIPFDRPYALEVLTSQKTAVPNGSKKLALYVLQTHSYSNPNQVGQKENDIWEVASESFLEKDKQTRERYQDIVTETATRLAPVSNVFQNEDGSSTIYLSFTRTSDVTASSHYFLQLTELIKQTGLEATSKFADSFANGVVVFAINVEKGSSQKKIDQLTSNFANLHLVPTSTLTQNFLKGEYSAEEYTYVSAASRFIYYFINQRSEEFLSLAEVLKNDALNLGRLQTLATSLKREACSLDRIYDTILSNPKLVRALFVDFATRTTTTSGSTTECEATLDGLEHKVAPGLDAQIFAALRTFNSHVRKTNLYKTRKSALSFRIDPSFLKSSYEWPVTPYGIFFVLSSDFQGFHVRFQDVARGGIRIIRSNDQNDYSKNLRTLFSENYNLASTQHRKNKDIPEFGSKGVILPHLDNKESFAVFQKYSSSILDLLIPGTEGIIDNLGQPEILFFGPDEGTADYMRWASEKAMEKGYAYARAFTTGKPPAIGGIPHDMFGMTTTSVHRYVINCLAKLGLDESQVTKVQTGGPDGDLGSNEIKISKDKTKALIDGSGVLYDPEGLNREELLGLAKRRVMIKEFDISKLGPGGFRVLARPDVSVTLPTGEVVENGLAFRNNFHLHPLFSADVFVPCGGRPDSINLSNVHSLLDKNGAPRWKIVVEGANLFLTQDARMVLENAGVILFKDASANKGGVTSSSLEVLSALALSDQDYNTHMCLTKKGTLPKFYLDYVNEIKERIKADADLEFAAIWREKERSGKYSFRLTDEISNKINELNLFVHDSSLYENPQLRESILRAATPKTLQGLVGLDSMMKRVPDAYLKSIFSAFIASRYVYKHGIDANEFAFFEFIQPFLKNEEPKSKNL